MLLVEMGFKLFMLFMLFMFSCRGDLGWVDCDFLISTRPCVYFETEAAENGPYWVVRGNKATITVKASQG